MQEATEAKAADMSRRLLEQANLRIIARQTEELEQARNALKRARLERAAEAAATKDHKDRETAALVRGRQEAWKVRSKLWKERKAAFWRAGQVGSSKAGAHAKPRRVEDYRCNNTNTSLTLTLTWGYDPLGTPLTRLSMSPV